MQNLTQKFRESSSAFLSEKLKTLTSPNYHRVQYFLLKLRTFFLLTNVYEIFFILFRSCVICKKITHSLFTFLLITQDLNKINPKHPFGDIVK